MAEEEEKDGCARRGEIVGKVTDQEIGRGPISLRNQANRLLKLELVGILETLALNVKNLKHIPSATTLLHLANRVNAEDDLPEEVYESFAEQLIKAFEELEKERDKQENQEQENQEENKPE